MTNSNKGCDSRAVEFISVADCECTQCSKTIFRGDHAWLLGRMTILCESCNRVVTKDTTDLRDEG